MTGYSVFKEREKTESKSLPTGELPENLSSQGVGIEKAVFAPLHQQFFKYFLMRLIFLLTF